ncbi:MAG: 50S ribosomal protein L9, partial [Candidatus Omnitrophica bacterium]|nr:50S ribosomal protein L9 [Candidatus Omnitrophota bacterium]
HDLAQPVTEAILKKVEQEKSARSALAQKIKEESIQLRERLSKLSLTIKALTQGEDKLYGSIHAQDIALVLKEEGFDIDKNLIDLPEAIKALGVYEVPVKLHAEVTAKIKLLIVKK